MISLDSCRLGGGSGPDKARLGEGQKYLGARKEKQANEEEKRRAPARKRRLRQAEIRGGSLALLLWSCLE